MRNRKLWLEKGATKHLFQVTGSSYLSTNLCLVEMVYLCSPFYLYFCPCVCLFPCFHLCQNLFCCDVSLETDSVSACVYPILSAIK